MEYLNVKGRKDARGEERKTPQSQLGIRIGVSEYKKPPQEISVNCDRTDFLSEADGKIINFSLHGLMIANKTVLRISKKMTICFCLPIPEEVERQNLIIVTCRVIWQKSESGDGRFPFLVGLQIELIEDSGRLHYERFYESIP